MGGLPEFASAPKTPVGCAGVPDSADATDKTAPRFNQCERRSTKNRYASEPRVVLFRLHRLQERKSETKLITSVLRYSLPPSPPCVRTYAHTYTHVRTHTHARTHARTHTRTDTHTHTRAHAHTHTHTHTHTQPACMHSAIF